MYVLCTIHIGIDKGNFAHCFNLYAGTTFVFSVTLEIDKFCTRIEGIMINFIVVLEYICT